MIRILKLVRTGASGTGRTTFVNTLCDSGVLPKKISDNPEEAHNEAGIKIKPVSVGKSFNFMIVTRYEIVIADPLFIIVSELDEDGVRYNILTSFIDEGHRVFAPDPDRNFFFSFHRISLTIVDTPGFGDNIDNEKW